MSKWDRCFNIDPLAMSRFSNLEFENREEENHQSKTWVKDDQYYLAQAQSAFERGDFQQALRDYSKVLEYDALSTAAWIGQVRMLIEMGEFDEAKLWADKALERLPNEPELLAAKGVALARLGDTEAALAYSDAAISEQGDTPYIWLARGDVLLARSEKRAEFCFDKALSLIPNSWLFQWLASRILYFYRKYALALKYIQQALNLHGTQSVIWLQYGLCQQALGMKEASCNSFEQALQLNPRCLDAEKGLLENKSNQWLKRIIGWGRRLIHP